MVWASAEVSTNSQPFFARLDELLSPGGSVITDACDLSYIYEDEDGFLDLTGVEGYYAR